MSGKRRATSDLNHENWDKDEEPEVAGTFQKATTDTIQKRIIRTAKRRSCGLGGSSSPDSQERPRNAFSSFGGFTASDSVKLSSGSDPKSTFSFLKTTPVTTNGKTDDNVSPLTSVTRKDNDVKSPLLSDSLDGKKYSAKLIHLNREVASWIESHVEKDPCCILTPIFRDYEKYLKEIEKKADGDGVEKESENSGSKLNFKLDSSQIKSTSGTEKPTLFSTFKSDGISQASTLLSKPDPASLMINPFTTKLDKNEGKTNKEEKTVGIKPFSFGNSTQPFQSTPSTGFSFGSTTPYTFGNVTPPVVNSKTTEEGETEDSDEPPKPEFKPVQEEDAVYSKRCKVFIKKESGYADLGIGTLFVKPVPGEKHQLLVRADTSLGNILVNVLLTPAIPLQRMAKNNVMMICVPTPPAAGTATPSPSTVLLRVKTAEEADQLLASLEKYRK